MSHGLWPLSIASDAGNASVPAPSVRSPSIRSPVESLWIDGQLVRILVDGAVVNGGLFDLVEIRVPAGAVGAPEQRQPWTDELLTVLGGEVAATLDGAPRRIAAGEHLEVAADHLFGWRCGRSSPCRVLIKSRPAGAVRLHRLLGTSLSRPIGPPTGLRADPRPDPRPDPRAAVPRAREAIPLIACGRTANRLR